MESVVDVSATLGSSTKIVPEQMVSESAPHTVTPVKVDPDVIVVAADVVEPPPESARPIRDDSGSEGSHSNVVVGNNTEEDDQKEQQTVYQTSSNSVDAAAVDDNEEEDQSWMDVLPPLRNDEEEKNPEEEYVGDIVVVDDEEERSNSPVVEPVAVASSGMATSSSASSSSGEMIERTSQLLEFVQGRDEPDFSQNKTNVAQRLYKAQLVADKSGMKSSPDLVPLTREYQIQRKKMANLIHAAEAYRDAMAVMAETKSKFLEQCAIMAQDTPIWNHIGTPLTPEQITNIQHVDDEITPESIDIQSQSIMKVAEELAGSAAGGSVIALSQLAAQSEKLNVMEYRNQILDYLDEWDDVVTNLLDDELKIIRKFNKKRTYYVSKVDGLREQVNRIEKRGAKRAPHRLVEKLERNEQKLQLSDQVYQEYSNTVALNLTESIRRGWVDLYPVLESIMEFEVNKLSRDNSILGQLSVILATYRDDFKDAVKGTADEV